MKIEKSALPSGVRKFRLLMVIGFGLCSTLNAGAVLIDNGAFVTDTTSGLDWLKLTETRNHSFNTVTGQLGAGGVFEGWTGVCQPLGLLLETGVSHVGRIIGLLTVVSLGPLICLRRGSRAFGIRTRTSKPRISRLAIELVLDRI